MSGGITLDWTVGATPVVLAESIEAYGRRLHAATLAHARRIAERLPGEMRRAASWTDRTGQARAGLYAEADSDGHRYVTLAAGHMAPHGVFLELKNENRFAVVIPTLDRYGRQLIRGYQGLMR